MIIVVMNSPRIKTLGPAIVVLMTAVAAAASAADAPRRYTGQTYEQLTTPPADSAEAANVRIWLALERPNRCRVGVRILDPRGNTIRNVFDGLLPGGYYNFYWDKKNDLGRYVDTGSYTYSVDDECSDPKRGQVKVVYRPWENVCLFYPPPDDNGSVLEYELMRDSVPVSFHLLAADTLVRTVFRDSLMRKGRYEFSLAADSVLPAGRYLAKLTIGDIVHSAYLWLRR